MQRICNSGLQDASSSVGRTGGGFVASRLVAHLQKERKATIWLGIFAGAKMQAGPGLLAPHAAQL